MRETGITAEQLETSRWRTQGPAHHDGTHVQHGEGAPGTLYRLDGDSLLQDRRTYMSLHEAGLAEVLSVGEFLGLRPGVRVLGVQPLEVASFGQELTPALQAVLPRVVTAALEELGDMGVSVTEQQRHPLI